MSDLPIEKQMTHAVFCRQIQNIDIDQANIDSLLNEYSIFTIPEKFHFFGCNAHKILGSFEEREIYNFLRSIILNEKENTNIRKKAIELHTEYILISKLKPRYALDILIESWKKTSCVFLEVRRLKDLFLFYELEQSDIKKIYQLFSLKMTAMIILI